MSWLNISDTHALQPGVDHNGTGEIVAKNADAIVIKWPRGTHWSGNYQPREYHSAETEVFKIISQLSDNKLEVKSVISWNNSRKKRPS